MIVKQVVNAFRIFELCAAEQRPLTLTQVAEALTIPVSSASNLIETLRRRGYLYEVRRRGGFYPTHRLLDVGTTIVGADPVLAVVRDEMERLREKTLETVLLCARDDDDVVYIDALPSPRSVRYAAAAGDRRPVYAVSSGKAMLAQMSDAALARELRQINYGGAGPRSITDPDALLTNIQEGRRRGWWLNATEYTPEVSGVGVAIRIAGRTLGLSIAGPNYRLEGVHESLAEALWSTVERLHRQIGGGDAEIGRDEADGASEAPAGANA